MKLKICIAFFGLMVVFAFTPGVKCLEEVESFGRSKSINSEDLKALAANSKLLVLIPSGLNLTENVMKNYESFSLFKLDTSVLFSDDGELKEPNVDDDISMEERRESSEERSNNRESRKINFFRNIWNKPRSSPLYLVNGTVCRFVDNRPICTTLSTSGLITNNTSALTNQRQPIAQGGGSGGGGGGGQGNTNQPRRSALMETDSPLVNIRALNIDSPIVLPSAKGQSGKIVVNNLQGVRAMRPPNFISKPISLLSLMTSQGNKGTKRVLQEPSKGNLSQATSSSAPV